MKNFRILTAAVLLTLLAGFTSCSSDDDDDATSGPAVELSVSVYDITLDSPKNSSASFAIKSNADWSIVNQPSWITLSSTKGNGNASVTVKAANDNETASNHTGSFTVVAGDQAIEITVIQLAGLIADCDVRASEVTVMSESVAFTYKFGKEVSYFYSLVIPAEKIGGYTDKALVEYVESNSKRTTPAEAENSIFYNPKFLDYDTEYYIVSFGYDRNENRGEIERRLIKTKKYYRQNERPSGIIGSTIEMDNNYNWLVDVTSTSSQTKSYYLFSETGSMTIMPQCFGGNTPQAVIALKMKRLIDSGELKSNIKDGDNIPVLCNLLSQYYYYTYVALWAVGEDGEFAGDIDFTAWDLN